MLADIINGTFELFGGLLMWLNVRAIRRDKEIKGVSWIPCIFFTTWGIWNLWYYPSLDQWFSFWGGVVLVAANATWIYHIWYYDRYTKFLLQEIDRVEKVIADSKKTRLKATTETS